MAHLARQHTARHETARRRFLRPPFRVRSACIDTARHVHTMLSFVDVWCRTGEKSRQLVASSWSGQGIHSRQLWAAGNCSERKPFKRITRLNIPVAMSCPRHKAVR